MQKRIAVLGSTGSVGTNALSLIRTRRERFRVVLLSANRSQERVAEQAVEFQPDAIWLAADDARGRSVAPAPRCDAFFGSGGLEDALECSQPDLVLNAITGAAGLPASEWTVRNGRTLALANKESMVMAGEYLMDLARQNGATILPVDSEHCAIFQCVAGTRPECVRKVYLTASGGPFRLRNLTSLADVTPAEALRHPTWEMGPRITIGSATMMNKAFEVVEARWLFGLAPEQIEVLVHPQSIVHSMVELHDGSILAQLGVPDMRVPILYCLGYPERERFDFSPFDPMRFRELNFEPVDPVRYPAVQLAYDVLEMGGDSGVVLNAADEVLTSEFLAGKVPFPAIASTTADIVRSRTPRPIRGLDDAYRADRDARIAALEAIATQRYTNS